MYHKIIRPLLFLFSAERAHQIASFFLIVAGWRITSSLFKIFYRNINSSSTVMGIEFPSKVGIAAGFDKNASYYRGLSALGFGFVEIGTVTPEPQPGNEKPRLFRLPLDNALINRMGFNNDGASVIAKRLLNRSEKIIIGGNIGKNKLTPNDRAIDDYEKCFEILYPYVDYFVVNVSSPNTPGLRELQEKEPLLKILNSLKALSSIKEKVKPILLKIAPDLTNEQLDDIIDIVNQSGIDGVIATNTTIERKNLKSNTNDIKDIGMGGLSGKPLKKRSLEVVKYLSDNEKNSFVIIGVGGIFSVSDAQEYINAGADLVQIYTGFIYEGPGLVKRINQSI